jgi:hypothetical protein
MMIDGMLVYLSGKLKSGEDVTLEDGRVVRSADVVGDAAPPASYIVLEIPDRQAHLPRSLPR